MVAILGANSVSGGYEIDNSLRFNVGDSPRLDRTSVGSPTNEKIFTYSVWLKKCGTGSNYTILDARSGNNRSQLLFRSGSNEAIRLVETSDAFSSFDTLITTNSLFRDCNAWYHIVLKYDSTNATANNRALIYVNGVEQSLDINTTVTSDYTTPLNENGYSNDVGHADGSEYFDGYIAEANFIDGQALAPSSFGENDEDSGIWKPIKYSGSYGNNGFYLKFENTSDAGEDSSGNSNDFTGSGIDSKDHVADTPTNNFATLNSIFHGKGSTVLSEGNCKFVGHNGGTGKVPSTIGVTSGKWYVEFKVLNTHKLRTGITDDIGISNDADGIVNDGVDFGFNDGYIYTYLNGSNNDTGAGSSSSGVDVDNPSANDILGIALDADNDTVRFYINNTAQGSEATDLQRASTSGAIHFFHVMDYSGSGDDEPQVECNFGNPPFAISSGNADANGYGNFEYTPPSGYYALCTKNLAEFG